MPIHGGLDVKETTDNVQDAGLGAWVPGRMGLASPKGGQAWCGAIGVKCETHKIHVRMSGGQEFSADRRLESPAQRCFSSSQMAELMGKWVRLKEA